MFRFIFIGCISFAIGASSMYSFMVPKSDPLKAKFSEKSKVELNSERNPSKALIDASDTSIKLVLCAMDGSGKQEVVSTLVMNMMLASDTFEQSQETLDSVFTTAVIAHVELNRDLPTTNTALLPIIRNYCNEHLSGMDCDKLDSLIEMMSHQPSSCT